MPNNGRNLCCWNIYQDKTKKRWDLLFTAGNKSKHFYLHGWNENYTNSYKQQQAQILATLYTEDFDLNYLKLSVSYQDMTFFGGFDFKYKTFL